MNILEINFVQFFITKGEEKEKSKSKSSGRSGYIVERMEK
jgi:hypothetical protein